VGIYISPGGGKNRSAGATGILIRRFAAGRKKPPAAAYGARCGLFSLRTYIRAAGREKVGSTDVIRLPAARRQAARRWEGGSVSSAGEANTSHIFSNKLNYSFLLMRIFSNTPNYSFLPSQR